MPTQASRSFLEVRSFDVEDVSQEQEAFDRSGPPTAPFLSLYEVGEGAPVDPAAEEFAFFLNELYSDEFDEALYELTGEAVDLYDSQFAGEYQDPRAIGHKAEKVLASYFEPLATQAETLIDNLASEIDRRDARNLTEADIEEAIGRCARRSDLSPSFENFLGGLLKKAARGALSLAKKGISVAIGPLLSKLKPLIKPLLNRVLKFAISKLPNQLQPVATKLAERIPFLKEMEDDDSAPDAIGVSEIQHEFNYQIAKLAFAPGNVEQDFEVARVVKEAQAPVNCSLADLDGAREEFINELSQIQEREDSTPIVENFVQAILPVLRTGIRLLGRPRVVGWLAKLLSKLIGKFVGPQHTPALSKAIVDAGLKLITLEVDPDQEARAAVAATVEDTVRRVAALPGYVLEDRELLEAFVLEAFEQAAAANLPAVLRPETYRKRPDLMEAKTIRGVWVQRPSGRRKRYKKFSRVIRTKVTPHKASSVLSFGAVPLSEFFEEQLGIAAGEDVDAQMHLYESMPGASLRELAHLERDTPGLGSPEAYQQLHPLTPDAAGMLLGEPKLGRETDPSYLANPYAVDVGQRFYYLEIPGKRPLMDPGVGKRPALRHRTGVRLVLDFRANQIRVHMYLSEIRAQEIAVKLRQQAHLGAVTTYLGRILERGARTALSSGFGRLKIVHETVTPDRWSSALQRLPSLIPRILLGRLQEWFLANLPTLLKQQAQQFIAEFDKPDDGVTLHVTIDQPPGFAHVRDALNGKVASLANLRLSGGAPAVSLRVSAGYAHE
jgi:hypothetical protein